MSYWAERKHWDYYQHIRAILCDLGPLRSLLDVGPFDTPLATWGTFSRRYTIDPRERPALAGVTAVRGRWPDDADELPLPVSVVTCCQVIEHLTDPLPFAAALFAAATHAVIISVPYRWHPNSCEYHVQDPIDEAKLERLVGRVADRSAIVSDEGWLRLISIYEVV